MPGGGRDGGGNGTVVYRGKEKGWTNRKEKYKVSVKRQWQRVAGEIASRLPEGWKGGKTPVSRVTD